MASCDWAMPAKDDACSTDARLGQISKDTRKLILFKLFGRIVTFTLNTLLLRIISPEIFGIATVKLEFFYYSVLYMSREGLRIALLQNYPKRGDKYWLKKVIHMSWLAIPCSLLPTIGLLFAFALTLPAAIMGLQRAFWLAIAGYMISVLIELASEPFHMICVYNEQLPKRMKAESIALTFRAAFVLSTFLLCRNIMNANLREGQSDIKLALLIFPLGQLLSSIILFIGLYNVAKEFAPGLSITENIPISEIEVDEPIIQQAIAMTSQIMFKYLLSQGDMWIVSLTGSSNQQGIYSIVTTYGSIFLRIVVQPLEDVAQPFFAQTKDNVALQYLETILKFYQICSFLLIIGATTILRPLIGVAFGKWWLDTQMPTVFSFYCVQLCMMSISGILEIFMNGKMQRGWNRTNQVATSMIAGLFFAASLPLSKRFGLLGLILGSIVNYVLRAAFSLHCLKKNNLLPTKVSLRSTTYMMFFVCTICVYFIALFRAVPAVVYLALLTTFALMILHVERSFLARIYTGNSLSVDKDEQVKVD